MKKTIYLIIGLAIVLFLEISLISWFEFGIANITYAEYASQCIMTIIENLQQFKVLVIKNIIYFCSRLT